MKQRYPQSGEDCFWRRRQSFSAASGITRKHTEVFAININETIKKQYQHAVNQDTYENARAELGTA